MKKMRPIFLGILLASFVAQPAMAEAKNSRSIDKNELGLIKAQLNRPDVANAWVLQGIEELLPGTECPSQRSLYVYSKPTLVQETLLTSNVTELLFNAPKGNSSSCDKLQLKKEGHLRAGRFIYKESSSQIIASHDAHKFFYIRGSVNDSQLILLRNVIEAAANCMTSKKGCDSIDLSIRLPEDATSRIRSVQGANISSIEGQVSPAGDGPFMILFRHNAATELIVFVSELTQKKPTVQVTFLMQ